MDIINNYILSLTQNQISNLYVMVSMILFPFLILMFVNYPNGNKKFYFSLLIMIPSVSWYFYVTYKVNSYYLSLNQSKYEFESRRMTLVATEKTSLGDKTETIKLKCEDNESIKECLNKIN
jgi:hypothetical protein